MAPEIEVERFHHQETGLPRVSGFLHRPETKSGWGIVLTHGAGGNCNSPLLVALADQFAENGCLSLRCDLPFRQGRPMGPPRPGNAAEDRAGLKSAALALKQLGAGHVLIGGQSYGGRQASMLAAEEPGLTTGLLLLSYPLHPPGKPDRLRTQHFPEIKVNALFVQGTNDPFATIAELKQAVKLITTRTVILPVEGAVTTWDSEPKNSKIGNCRERSIRQRRNYSSSGINS